ncbi:MAG: SMP-30/gluconolactonase/LRE family protein [Myxococcales bacterium]|nr:SMP-30/gluconolactonase/LRE family protein [Myxococcales bacterium]
MRACLILTAAMLFACDPTLPDICPPEERGCLPGGEGLQPRYVIPGDDTFPESVTYDPRRAAFFVSSLGHGTVTRVEADGTTEVFYPGTGEADRVTVGVEVDTLRDRLFVCTLRNVDPPAGRIWIFNLQTGERTHDVDLSTAARDANCNDITVDSSGRAYITDREHGIIYRLIPGDDGHAQVNVFARDALLDPPLVGIGLNGIALTPDGDALLAVQYLPPRLYRIDFANPADVIEVDLDGDLLFDELLSGADGITFFGGQLYVALGGSLVRITADDPGWFTAHFDRLELADASLSGVTAADGALYVLDSDVTRFVLGGQPDLPFELLRVDPNAFNR